MKKCEGIKKWGADEITLLSKWKINHEQAFLNSTDIIQMKSFDDHSIATTFDSKYYPRQTTWIWLLALCLPNLDNKLRCRDCSKKRIGVDWAISIETAFLRLVIIINEAFVEYSRVYSVFGFRICFSEIRGFNLSVWESVSVFSSVYCSNWSWSHCSLKRTVDDTCKYHHIVAISTCLKGVSICNFFGFISWRRKNHNLDLNNGNNRHSLMKRSHTSLSWFHSIRIL